MSDVINNQTESVEDQRSAPICSRCGAELDADSQFCPQCGAAVGKTAADTGGSSRIRRPVDRRSPVAAEVGVGSDTDVLGRRIGATIADWILASLGAVVLGAVLGFLFGAMAGSENVYTLVFWLTAVPAFWLYYVLLEANGGETLGKKILGIKVVKQDGSDIALSESFIRNTLRIIDGFLYYLPGFIIILASSKNQRIGDMAAKTLVIRTE